MTKEITLDELWASATLGQHVFHPDEFLDCPEAVRRYLEHAIAPDTKLASAVRLKMHGEIKLKDWLPFKAEQVICWNRGLIWNATVRMYGLPIIGSDRLIDRVGAMKWKLLGLFPMMTASGADITRSAIGRMQAESVWLPSALCDRETSWAVKNSSHLYPDFAVQGEKTELDFTIDDMGGLKSLKMQRWNNLNGIDYRYEDFGGIVEAEGKFSGYTIPTQLRIGWYFGTDRFEPEGEFFRVTIDDAIYR
ncbi:DUF3598 domain-containing protein [Tumidithrix helvetica PCC 7403]|uniref:DUF6920 family protein n=1 Tax=Tumidithrix helvetica TaxID=3457545 RepID=UPI003CC21D55